MAQSCPLWSLSPPSILTQTFDGLFHDRVYLRPSHFT